MTILCCVGLLLVIFCLPETRYRRSPGSVSGQMYYTDEFGHTRAISDEEAREYGLANLSSSDAPTCKRSYISRLSPVNTPAPDGIKLALSVVAKMLSCLSSPAVVWAILASSISLG